MADLIYAGIGSRETPPHILQKMRSIGYNLGLRGYTLRSGRAIGADQEFEAGCDQARGKKEIFVSRDATPEAIEIALKYHPNPEALKRKGQYVVGLMGRNIQIVEGRNINNLAERINFAVCWTKDGRDSGGTGQAIRYCWDKGIKVYNLFNSQDVWDLKYAIWGELKLVEIDFYPDNLELLDRGFKTSTLRTNSQAAKIGLKEGERGFFRDFIVTCIGNKFCNEVGGKEHIWNCEGFEYTQTKFPKFSSTIEFLENKRPLWVYSFERIA